MMRERGVKRFNDGYGGGAGGVSKRTRLGPDDIEIRALIPSKVAGSIIGKGGSNIARLRENAKVTVPDCPGLERILTVIATEEQAVKVIQDILPHLNTFQGTGRRSESDNEVDLRILVHQSQAGCVIGRAGGKVKELREKTGARVKIYSSCCPDSTDRVVQINGPPNTVVDCLKEVLELLKLSPVKGAENPYDPNNWDDFYADAYGGYGSGGGGAGGGRYGPPSRDGRGPPPPPGRFAGPRGSGPPVGPPPGGYDDYGDDEDDYGAPPRPGMGNGAGRSSTQVTIPKDLAGAIIGTAGQRIRKVRNDSGADITIDEPLPGSADRIITIVGSPNQIQMAQYLLQQCVHQYGKSGRGGRY